MQMISDHQDNSGKDEQSRKTAIAWFWDVISSKGAKGVP